MQIPNLDWSLNSVSASALDPPFESGKPLSAKCKKIASSSYTVARCSAISSINSRQIPGNKPGNKKLQSSGMTKTKAIKASRIFPLRARENAAGGRKRSESRNPEKAISFRAERSSRLLESAVRMDGTMCEIRFRTRCSPPHSSRPTAVAAPKS